MTNSKGNRNPIRAIHKRLNRLETELREHVAANALHQPMSPDPQTVPFDDSVVIELDDSDALNRIWGTLAMSDWHDALQVLAEISAVITLTGRVDPSEIDPQTGVAYELRKAK